MTLSKVLAKPESLQGKPIVFFILNEAFHMYHEACVLVRDVPYLRKHYLG